jgi:acetyl-CoA carboxylase biotin carboxyl carrier protein
MDDKTLLSIIDKFGSSNLAELEIDEGNLHIALRKDSAVAGRSSGGTVSATTVNVSNTTAAPAEVPVSLGMPASSSPSTNGEAITSPIVATFYSTPSPDTPAFVKVGSKVKAGDTLCILEAMKMMNHLEAEFDCEILAVKAGNGDLVEYGQTLFEVKRL